MSLAQYRSPGFKKLVSGEAMELIRDGKPGRQVMQKERMTMDDIKSSLRARGIDSIERVRLGYLEDDGEISAPLYREAEAGDQNAMEQSHRKKSQMT